MKFDILGFLENSVKKIQVSLKHDKNNGYFTGRLVYLIFMDPCIVDYSADILTRYSFVIEFIIPNFIEGSTYFERHTAHHKEL
jgi:hypothetical protein